jgi:16S rRNA (uracil1498-N3)-methyltransferase
MPGTPASFLVLDQALDTLCRGDRYVLAGEQGRHAAKVARIRVGERILLTSADGRQVTGEVTQAHKESLELLLLADPMEATIRKPRLALVQALATGGRDEQAVESATELGVDRVTPWMATRSVSVWKGEKLRKGRARWIGTAQAAVKQSRRAGIPVVDEPVSSAALAADVRERVAGRGLVFVLHEQEHRPLLAFAEVTVIVGPEGGITEDERGALVDAGARPVLLGPEVLRSSTAGPAAIAVLSALVGRWG